ncbi:hypothetical protein SNE40_012954 [Patella caerulea]|uniref:protein-tyrosine-phosphatase n=1 Tax=Patella caerulea TaxID=87958 RepID=A0AAN8JIF2_PATCE
MLSPIEKELSENDHAKVWNEFYQRIKNEASLRTLDDDKYKITAARKPENRNKNRYRDVSPYDHSRIVVEKGDDDYINASLVEVASANRKYILAQGPLEHTAGQFWQAVWEQQSKAIIMLNRVIEKETIKCHQYWPLGSHQDYEDEMLFEDVELRVSLLQEEEYEHYTKRLFSLEDMETGDKRDVTHFHYTTWPDFGVPSSPTAFLNFLMAVRETGCLESDCGPAVIHCSAGIGRSGTFCLVDSCLVQIERERSMKCVDIRSILIEMRSFRMGLIQTPDQLRFSYLAVIEGGKRILSDADANSNVKTIAENTIKKEDAPPTPPIRSSSLQKVQLPDEPPELPPKVRPDWTKQINDDTSEDIIPAKQRKIEERDDYQSPAKQRKLSNRNGGTDLNDRQDLFFNKPDEVKKVDDSEVVDKIDEVDKDGGSVGDVDEDDESKQLNILRKRVRGERKKQTAEMIKKMKEKQKKSELWKERKSYLKPICFGITLLIGSYLLYRYCW